MRALIRQKTKKSPQASREPALKLGTLLHHTEPHLSIKPFLPGTDLRECAAPSTAFL